MSRELDRREVLGIGVGAALAGVLSGGTVLGGCASGTRTAGPGGGSSARSLRIAHLTDTHIQPERDAYQGVAACLKHVSAQRRRPDLVVTGGDLIMDGFENSEQRTREQWDLWTRVFRDECAIPVEHTLGNHDIWGWNKARSGTTGGEPMWGKRWACDLFGWQRPYRVVERGAWRLVILDSVQPRGDAGYTANLDPEQMEWLRAELARDRARHVCVVSHIPILGVTPIAGTGEVKDGDWHINGSLMHTDSHALIKLFKEAGNVRLCLSGHIHKLDRCEYEGTTYVCGGAVCGAWWKGPRDRVAEGYGLVDLYADGTFDYAYQTYGWVASEA